jgi:hypothetical protein
MELERLKHLGVVYLAHFPLIEPVEEFLFSLRIGALQNLVQANEIVVCKKVVEDPLADGLTDENAQNPSVIEVKGRCSCLRRPLEDGRPRYPSATTQREQGRTAALGEGPSVFSRGRGCA